MQYSDRIRRSAFEVRRRGSVRRQGEELLPSFDVAQRYKDLPRWYIIVVALPYRWESLPADAAADVSRGAGAACRAAHR